MKKIALRMAIISAALFSTSLASAAPADSSATSVKYFKVKTNVTNTFVRTKTKTPLPTESRDDESWSVDFYDGLKTYSFAYARVPYSNAHFVELEEKMESPASPNGESHWRFFVQDFSLRAEDPTNTILKSYDNSMSLKITPSPDGSLVGVDATGKWPKGESVLMSTSVNTDGSQVAKMFYRNLNSVLGYRTLVSQSFLAIAKPIAMDDLYDVLNVRTIVFLNDFTRIHQNAVGIASDLAACLAIPSKNCDQLKNEYDAADSARDKAWASLQVDDVDGLQPVPPVVVTVTSDGDDGSEGGGCEPNPWGSCTTPNLPPAAPTPECGRHGCR